MVWVCGPPAFGEAANRVAEGDSNSVYIDSVFDAGTVPSVSVEFESLTSAEQAEKYAHLFILPYPTYLHHVPVLTFSLRVLFVLNSKAVAFSCMVNYICVRLSPSAHIFTHLNILLIKAFTFMMLLFKQVVQG